MNISLQLTHSICRVTRVSGASGNWNIFTSTRKRPFFDPTKTEIPGYRDTNAKTLPILVYFLWRMMILLTGQHYVYWLWFGGCLAFGVFTVSLTLPCKQRCYDLWATTPHCKTLPHSIPETAVKNQGFVSNFTNPNHRLPHEFCAFSKFRLNLLVKA
jgi:hypothetical protein